jgi:hypothetical protein
MLATCLQKNTSPEQSDPLHAVSSYNLHATVASSPCHGITQVIASAVGIIAPNLEPELESAERPYALCRRDKVCMFSRRENRSCAYPQINRPHQTKNLNRNS